MHDSRFLDCLHVVPAFCILLQSIELDDCIKKMAQLGAIRLFLRGWEPRCLVLARWRATRAFFLFIIAEFENIDCE